MKRQLSFEAIGTWWEIDIEDVSDDLFLSIKKEIDEFLSEFDSTYSRFISTSLVNQIAEKPGEYSIPADGMEMLKLYKNLYHLTEGAFTPLIGQTLADAGYDEKYSFKEKKLSHPPSFSGTVRFISDTAIKVNKPVILDFGGVGKGYAIDKVKQILFRNELEDFTINAGGDIYHHHPLNLPIRIGMENPMDTQQVLGVVDLNNESICSSAGNRRAWENYHHIINPHTLTSPKDILAVWIIAETTTVADAIATCLFLVKPDILMDNYSFNYFILYPDFSFDKSSGFKGQLFLR